MLNRDLECFGRIAPGLCDSPPKIIEPGFADRDDARIARRKVELLAEFDVATTELSDILAAIDLHRLHGFSFWDGMIVRAANQTGCRVLFSEDLQHARDIDGVAIINPFRS